MKVYVTRSLPGNALDRLRQACEVQVEDRPYVEAELPVRAQGCDAVICQLSHRVSADTIEQLNVRVIANYAVGYDNIDIPAADAKGIYVTNTPDALTNTTAELAWALIFSCARRTVEGDSFVRSGRFTGWQPDLLLGRDLTGKTLGIIGAGRIGQAVARMSAGFGMKIIYHNRNKSEKFENLCGAVYVSLNELLEKSDFVSINCPLTDATRHMIGKRELEKMKRTAVLVNTARGPIIDEAALADALDNKQIFSAGLDVYEFEPKVTEKLKLLSNCVLLPHVGSGTEETRAAMADMAVENVLNVLNGKPPINSVNKIQF